MAGLYLPDAFKLSDNYPTVVPAISDISQSPMMGFFKPEEEAIMAKKAYEDGIGDIQYLNSMPRNFDEGAAFYYTSKGNTSRHDNRATMWSQLELVKYNVPKFMKSFLETTRKCMSFRKQVISICMI